MKARTVAIATAILFALPAQAANFVEYRMGGAGTAVYQDVNRQPFPFVENQQIFFTASVIIDLDDPWFASAFAGEEYSASAGPNSAEFLYAYSVLGGRAEGWFSGMANNNPDGSVGGGYSFSFHDHYTSLTGSGAFTRFSVLDDVKATEPSVTVQWIPLVPEPATWAFMIVGFGAVGASLRSRRRGKPALPAAA